MTTTTVSLTRTTRTKTTRSRSLRGENGRRKPLFFLVPSRTTTILTIPVVPPAPFLDHYRRKGSGRSALVAASCPLPTFQALTLFGCPLIF